MRTPFIAGNWKMHKTIQEAVAFAKAVKEPLNTYTGVDKAICAPAVQLVPLASALSGSSIQLGAQNLFWEDQGAYTGEISPVMLKGICQLVIIGHSERRAYFHETDETVNRKIKAALAHDLTPIVCVGESLEQNEAGETEGFVGQQVRAAFEGISEQDARNIVVAYEPIWAIGTGKAATPQEANRIIGEVVRGTLGQLYGDDTARQIRIQYGGSMKPANVRELMEQPEIDGGLVGGASLQPDSFIELVTVTAELRG